MSTSADVIKSRLGAEVWSGLSTVSTATLTSQLRRRGLMGCIFAPLVRLGHAERMVGFARTVRYLPLREDLFPERSAGFNAQKRAVDAVEPGEILVIEARGVMDAGTIGDILALRVQVRGGAGIVTDGPVRDHAAIDALDIPTYTAGRHPAPLGVRHTPGETDVAVTCGGVLVEPGDLLVGDTDGVVLLPSTVVAEVVADSVRQEQEEAFIANQVASGAAVDGLYPMNAEWRSRWESGEVASE